MDLDNILGASLDITTSMVMAMGLPVKMTQKLQLALKA